jgi:hypothetical protein
VAYGGFGAAHGTMRLVVFDAINLDKVGWGTWPEWVAAVGSVLGLMSVFLAWRVLKRDRDNADRAQVDRVGAWATAAYERRGPHQTPRIEEAEITGYARNGSELPVRVVQIAFRIETKWAVEADVNPQSGEVMSWVTQQGVEPVRKFTDPRRVPPGETLDWSLDANVAHTAPDRATQLALSDGVDAHVDWILIIDNAGLRWEVRPESGGRAKRVRWWWRPEEYMPREW